MTKNLVTLKLYPETCRRNFALETMEDVSENPDSRVVIWRAGGIVKSGSQMYTEFNKSTGTPAHHLFSEGHEVSCPHGIHHPAAAGEAEEGRRRR